MAKPLHPFTADWCLDELVPHVRLWSRGVVDKMGSDPGSSDVEDFLLRILGVPNSLHAFCPGKVSA